MDSKIKQYQNTSCSPPHGLWSGISILSLAKSFETRAFAHAESFFDHAARLVTTGFESHPRAESEFRSTLWFPAAHVTSRGLHFGAR